MLREEDLSNRPVRRGLGGGEFVKAPLQVWMQTHVGKVLFHVPPSMWIRSSSKNLKIILNPAPILTLLKTAEMPFTSKLKQVITDASLKVKKEFGQTHRRLSYQVTSSPGYSMCKYAFGMNSSPETGRKTHEGHKVATFVLTTRRTPREPQQNPSTSDYQHWEALGFQYNLRLFFFFFWPHLWPMEIPGPGRESEPQLWPLPQQRWIL